MHIATMYTREAGVRSLERAIGAVVRYKAVEWAEHVDSSLTSTDKQVVVDSNIPSKAPSKEYRRVVETAELEKILGIARWDADERERDERRGVVYGLVVTGMGEGGILPIETLLIPSGSGKLMLTGSLGEVIKESGELALSWVKTHAYELGITQHRSIDPLKIPGEARDIHLHLPSGAVKKDGPSAGIAMVCTFSLRGVRMLTFHADLRFRLAAHGSLRSERRRHDRRSAYAAFICISYVSDFSSRSLSAAVSVRLAASRRKSSVRTVHTSRRSSSLGRIGRMSSKTCLLRSALLCVSSLFVLWRKHWKLPLERVSSDGGGILCLLLRADSNRLLSCYILLILSCLCIMVQQSYCTPGFWIWSPCLFGSVYC